MAQEAKVDRELNLKGEICPYTFIKSKLALEDIEVGQVLRVIVDFQLSSEDVPRGMEFEGQKVLKVEKINPTDWEIIIRKEK